MDEDQQKILLNLADEIFLGLDEIFGVAYNKHAGLLEDPDAIYQTFVVALAQELGRQIAAFPESERDQITLEALEIQEEMTALVSTEIAKAELEKAKFKPLEGKYDLAKMKPEGNA